jgi:hypothetical protein
VPLQNEPTLPELKAWLRLDDTIDDDALAEGLSSAIDYQTRYYRIVDAYPDDLRLAAMLRAARYLARRMSPEGLVGFGDFGPAQIATVDRDVRELEAPYAKPVVA